MSFNSSKELNPHNQMKNNSEIDTSNDKIQLQLHQLNLQNQSNFIKEIRKIIENEVNSSQQIKSTQRDQKCGLASRATSQTQNNRTQTNTGNFVKKQTMETGNLPINPQFFNMNLGNTQKIIKINPKLKRKKKRKIKKVKLETIPEEKSNVDFLDSPFVETKSKLQNKTKNQNSMNLIKAFKSNKKAERIEINLKNFQNINVYNIYNGSNHLVKRSFDQTHFFTRKNQLLGPELKKPLNKKLSSLFSKYKSEKNDFESRKNRTSKMIQNFPFKNKNLFKSQRKLNQATFPRICEPSQANIKYAHSQDVIWNSFLNKEDENEDYRNQLENILHKTIMRFSSDNNVAYSEKNIFLFLKLQIELDNNKFRALQPKTKIKVFGMIFSKFVNRFELSNILEHFLSDVDFRKSRSPCVSIYK